MKHLLLTLLIAASFLCASRSEAATITNVFSFQWQPTPVLMGGLSTNDYFTNVVFRLYGTTNVALPVSNWPLQTTLPAQPFLTQGPPGTDWTYPFVRPSGTMFFVMTAYVAKAAPGGDESPFSNTDFQLERPSTGPRINSLR